MFQIVLDFYLIEARQTDVVFDFVEGLLFFDVFYGCTRNTFNYDVKVTKAGVTGVQFETVLLASNP